MLVVRAACSTGRYDKWAMRRLCWSLLTLTIHYTAVSRPKYSNLPSTRIIFIFVTFHLAKTCNKYINIAAPFKKKCELRVYDEDNIGFLVVLIPKTNITNNHCGRHSRQRANKFRAILI